MNKMMLLTVGLLFSGMASLVVAEEMKPVQAPVQSAPAAPKKSMKMKKKGMKKAEGKKQEAKAQYICEMCHIKSDKPGKCPQCGMEMKKI